MVTSRMVTSRMVTSRMVTSRISPRRRQPKHTASSTPSRLPRTPLPNTVWYPRYEYDLPILGMDLISLGKSRVLSVIDFQPLHSTTEYSAKYIDQLSSIRDKYPDLHGTLSGKIYHDALFFSKQMLFGRMADESKVMNTVYPAYQEYTQAYLDLMANAVPDFSPESMASVRCRQSAYDAYNAVKDPAVGLYDAYFGKEWSDHFVHNFLFDQCREGEFGANIENKQSSTCSTTIRECTSTEQSLSHSTENNIHSNMQNMPQAVHNFRIDADTGEIITNKTVVVAAEASGGAGTGVGGVRWAAVVGLPHRGGVAHDVPLVDVHRAAALEGVVQAHPVAHLVRGGGALVVGSGRPSGQSAEVQHHAVPLQVALGVHGEGGPA